MAEAPVTPPPSDPAVECSACGQLIATTKDRFCASCGARLMRADLREEAVTARIPRPAPSSPSAPALPAPSVTAHPVPWVVAPAPKQEHRGVIVATAASVLVGLIGLAIAVILAVSAGEDPIDPVGAPTVATPPTTVTILERR